MEFIDAKDAVKLDADDSAQALIRAMEANKTRLVNTIGQLKYDDEVALLGEVEKDDEKRGAFQAIAGDVDERPDSLKDAPLGSGFAAVCGIRGGALSGGQKQRVAIARTIIRQPAILILDEATSALDETSQKKVQGALANAMEGRTTIIIAHRMSTIENCDKIFVLENGTVAEEGGFNELKAGGGLFAKISSTKQ